MCGLACSTSVCFLACVEVILRSSVYNVVAELFRVQVISIVSGFRLKWPPEVLTLMSALSFSNFNMDLAKPECSIPTFKWFERWWCSMLLPFVASFIIVAAVCLLGPMRRFLTGVWQIAAVDVYNVLATPGSLFPSNRTWHAGVEKRSSSKVHTSRKAGANDHAGTPGRSHRQSGKTS